MAKNRPELWNSYSKKNWENEKKQEQNEKINKEENDLFFLFFFRKKGWWRIKSRECEMAVAVAWIESWIGHQ